MNTTRSESPQAKRINGEFARIGGMAEEMTPADQRKLD
jgi:hypothetical protein